MMKKYNEGVQGSFHIYEKPLTKIKYGFHIYGNDDAGVKMQIHIYGKYLASMLGSFHKNKFKI